jgi:mRNA-degrading endonuclease RelE of RelBE toxin-antitoxin system
VTPWSLSLAPAARRDRDRLPDADRTAVSTALDRLTPNPTGMDIKKLQGRSDEWRPRVGNWRVRFTWDRPHHTIIVFRILDRKDAYKD